MSTLVIGNRNYSSWSLRAWLFLKESDLEFDTVRLAMFTGDWAQQVAKYSPAGRVPVLVDDPVRVWDSMAIIQYIHEKYPPSQNPSIVGWPEDLQARAHARSVAAEMHSGFISLRGELPQNLRKRTQFDIERLSRDCRHQIARVLDIWATCRERHGDKGPWLFGRFSVADVFYAPVALRFETYGIDVPAPGDEFVHSVIALPAVQEWSAAAADEAESIAFIDDLVPTGDIPMTIG